MTNNISTGQATEDTVLAARLRKSAIAEVRILTQIFHGKRFVHMREYILGDDNEFCPTRKGVSFPFERLSAVSNAVKALQTLGLTPGVAARLDHSGGEVRFSVSEWKGDVKGDIRSWFQDSNGVLQPGKGLRFNLSLVPEILRALKALNVENGE